MTLTALIPGGGLDKPADRQGSAELGISKLPTKNTLPLIEPPPQKKTLSEITIHLAKVKHDMIMMENPDYWSIWCIKLDPKILLKIWNI